MSTENYILAHLLAKPLDHYLVALPSEETKKLSKGAVKDEMFAALTELRQIQSVVGGDTYTCITGGAVNDWADGKLCRDVDIIVSVSPDNASVVCNKLLSLGYYSISAMYGDEDVTVNGDTGDVCFLHKMANGKEYQLLVTALTLDCRIRHHPCSKSQVALTFDLFQLGGEGATSPIVLPNKEQGFLVWYGTALWFAGEDLKTLFFGGVRSSAAVFPAYMDKIRNKYPTWSVCDMRDNDAFMSYND